MESLEILIEFGLGLAGFAGIIVALGGDPASWPQHERVRVFGLIFSALLACFMSLLCLTLGKYYSQEFSARVSSGIFFLIGLYFFPRQVYRTFFIFRQDKANYSQRITITFSVITLIILIISLLAAFNLLFEPFSMFYTAVVLTLLFAAITYVRVLLYRPAGSRTKIKKSR
ncbi:hypothetical protein N9060_00240 [Arenicella sp.]|nr:hypothetical protein [Arenicella sp.]